MGQGRRHSAERVPFAKGWPSAVRWPVFTRFDASLVFTTAWIAATRLARTCCAARISVPRSPRGWRGGRLERGCSGIPRCWTGADSLYARDECRFCSGRLFQAIGMGRLPCRAPFDFIGGTSPGWPKRAGRSSSWCAGCSICTAFDDYAEVLTGCTSGRSRDDGTGDACREAAASGAICPRPAGQCTPCCESGSRCLASTQTLQRHGIHAVATVVNGG